MRNFEMQSDGLHFKAEGGFQVNGEDFRKKVADYYKHVAKCIEQDKPLPTFELIRWGIFEKPNENNSFKGEAGITRYSSDCGIYDFHDFEGVVELVDFNFYPKALQEFK